MNISITTVQQWIGNKENYMSLPKEAFDVCSLFDVLVNESIHSDGGSTLSRVFMADSDKEMHHKAYEYAKEGCSVALKRILEEHKERRAFTSYQRTLMLRTADYPIVEGTYTPLPN